MSTLSAFLISLVLTVAILVGVALAVAAGILLAVASLVKVVTTKSTTEAPPYEHSRA